MNHPLKRKSEKLFDSLATDPRSAIVWHPRQCSFLVSGKNNFKEGLIEYVVFVLFIVFHLLKIAKYWQVEMFVAHARLSQYVNPAKQLPCLCLSPSLTGQVDISPFLQKTTSSVHPIEPLPSQVWTQRSPQSRWNPFISPLFAPSSVWFQFFPGRSDSRFESALLPPHLEVGWFGRATRKWWDTKYRAWRADYFARRIFVSSGWPQKSLCLTFSKFVLIIKYQQPINLDDVLGWHDKLKDVHNTFSLRGPITNFETLFYN